MKPIRAVKSRACLAGIAGLLGLSGFCLFVNSSLAFAPPASAPQTYSIGVKPRLFKPDQDIIRSLRQINKMRVRVKFMDGKLDARKEILWQEQIEKRINSNAKLADIKVVPSLATNEEAPLLNITLRPAQDPGYVMAQAKIWRYTNVTSGPAHKPEHKLESIKYSLVSLDSRASMNTSDALPTVLSDITDQFLQDVHIAKTYKVH